MSIKESIAIHPLILFRDFRLLFFARLISAIGDRFFTIALAWYVISQGSESSKIHLGFLMAINMLPIVIFGPLLGPLADRFNKKYCMLIADFCRGLFVLILVYLLITNQLVLSYIYILCFLISLFVPLFESASKASLISLTDTEYTSQVVAFDSMVEYISNVLGALLGSLFLAILGLKGALILNALSFICSFLLVIFIHRPLLPTLEAGAYKEQIIAGFSYIKKPGLF